MTDPELEKYVSLCESDNIEEVTDIIAASAQALDGAKSLVLWFDCWNPAATVGDTKKFSIGTALDTFTWVGLSWGWYGGRKGMVKVNRIAMEAFSSEFDQLIRDYKLPFEGQISQPRTVENHAINIEAAVNAEKKLLSIFKLLLSSEDVKHQPRITG